MAKLYFRYGAMNSGKSTALLQAAYNYEERDQHVLLSKPAVDRKGGNDILSRLGARRPVDFVITPGDNVLSLFKEQEGDRDVDAPMNGIVPRSLNVGHAAAIIIGEYARQHRFGMGY